MSSLPAPMRALVGSEWKDGALDYCRGKNEYRIGVVAWRNLEKLDDLYFQRPKSLSLIWNYLREIGPLWTLRKVVSRYRERHRNDKYVSVGYGRVIEAPDRAALPIGQAVAFLALSHPACVERLALPGELMVAVDDSALPDAPANVVLYREISGQAAPADRWWGGLAGWSPYSGASLTDALDRETMAKTSDLARETDWRDARQLRGGPDGPVAEATAMPASAMEPGLKRAALFGYGHYARTIVLPAMRRHIPVDSIHEIDPLQIPPDARRSGRWDTSPVPRENESSDVFLIAGYHHTHAPLAIEALNRGAYAVVEKPVATDERQLNALVSAMAESDGGLFSCFHKRYLPFNAMVIEDLGVRAGDPVSYHCIVYEVPLPARHWYRWPNSKSRLISNGCHWIDHFLYLNDFCPARSFDLAVGPDETINCSIALENDAFFTMVLTDKGSERIGLQDYVELRAGDATVKTVNGSLYKSENGNRVMRKKKMNRMESYRIMYDRIGKAIKNGEGGESVESVKNSAGLILALEDRYNSMVGGSSKHGV